MSKDHALESLIADAQRKEREYDWLQASELYAKAIVIESKKEGFRKAGELQENVGFCYYRAAMQADSKEGFIKRLQRSVDAYEKAYKLHEDVAAKTENAKQLRCDAILKYLRYWLTSKPPKKKKLLDECLESEDKALAAFSKLGEFQEYQETYSTLWLVFFCRVFLERDREILKTILEKGLEWGTKAIKKCQKKDEPSKTAATYLTLAMCLSDAGFYLVSESENTDINRLEAIDYLRKALALSESVGDGFLSGLCHVWLGINGGGEEAAGHHEKAFEYGKLTRDNFLIANSLDFLAYDTYWKALATESPQRRTELAREAMQFYEKAIRRYSVISFLSPRGGFIGPPSGQAEHYYQLAKWETDRERRKKLLAKSEKAGIESLRIAEESEMPMVIANVQHVLAKTLQYKSYTVVDITEKRNYLERALEHRKRTVQIFDDLTPFFYWNLGVMRNYLSEIKAELADVEQSLGRKRKLLEDAVQDKEDCLRLLNRVMPYLERKGETSLFAGLRDFQDSFFTMLTRLHSLTNKPRHLRKAIEISKNAITSANKLNMVTLVAESYWKIGKTQDILGEHRQAAESFKCASQNYLTATGKIPQLRDFYQDHAAYMQAWSEIEQARDNHVNKQYGQAQEHYEKAANIHQSTKRWRYLASNYFAWADLEAAEDLSRREQTNEAKKFFQKAAKSFQDTEVTLESEQSNIENLDERDLINRLIKASGIRYAYCLGRIALEEAKMLSREGGNAASAAKYGIAANRFQSVLDMIEGESSFTDATLVKDRQELAPIISLCKAWQMMKRAEAQASPELFQKASQLFDEAKERSFDEETKLLALGHSHFCKALSLGTEYEDSRDESLYISATQHLESAANYYVRAGFKFSSEYAVATQRLLDAYVYMANAKKEVDPTRKAKYFTVAEKLLQTSIESYTKAKHPAKSEQVQRLLEKVREERALATSLIQILDVPTITSSTTSFLIPTPSEETAVGLERFESANIEGNTVASSKKVSIGANLKLKIQVSNVSKQTVLLDKIQGVPPPGFRLVTKPSYCDYENSYLIMNGKRLGPLKTEEITLVLNATKRGTYHISPEIQYVDETGHQLAFEPEPVTIENLRIILPNRLATGYESLDDALFGGIPEKYAVMVTSPHFEELDMLIRSFLETGVKEKQITFYFTTKPTDAEKFTKEFKSNFFLFFCNPQADAIVESSLNAHNLRGVENLTEINMALTSTLRNISEPKGRARRCCIRIVSDVLLQHKALQTRRWLTSLISELKSGNFTVLAVIDPGMHSTQEVKAVLDLFDGEISICEKTEYQRFLRIGRMADQDHLENEIPLNTLQ
jgi:KaiC/GvpD/RAD55 family RecA-like ATPase